MDLHFSGHLPLWRRGHGGLRAPSPASARRNPRRAHTSYLTAACTIAVAIVVSAQVRLLSVEDEIQIGRESQKEVRKQLPQLTDREVTSYVATIGRRLAARATGPRYPYSFTVANYREVNAFALPGGPVWIHRGAIAAAENEAQLAAILAHEIAHISERHAADRMTTQLVANGFIGLLGAMLGNGQSAQTAQIGARAMAGGYMLKFSREDERDADAVGAAIMRRAGWDAREMIRLMETLRKQEGRDPASFEVFLSSHPAPEERASRLRSSLRGGGTKDSPKFRQIKARLAKLPRARSMR
jgi:predicted Zn-dependent protease